MNVKDFDAILESLDRKAMRQRDIALATEKQKMEAIQQIYVSYYDGAYDSLKAVKNALQTEGADDATA